MADKSIHCPDRCKYLVGFEGHMTKMATIPIYGKKNNYILMTVLVDSQVSDRCPWATCYCKVISRSKKEHTLHELLFSA